MKHNIKQLIILVLMLVGNITAWADETVTYKAEVYDCRNATYNGTVYRDGYIKFKVGSSKDNYQTLVEYTQTITSTTAQGFSISLGDFSLVVDNSPSYLNFKVSANEFSSTNSTTPFTVTISSTNYYVANVQASNSDESWRKKYSGNEKNLAFSTSRYEIGGNIMTYDGIHSLSVTLSDTKPVLDISGATVTGIADSYDYTGSAITPAITGVTLNTGTTSTGTLTLSAGTDYTVSYANNTNAGTATVTLTGQGDYTGTWSKDFTINKVDVTLTAPTPVTTDYTGTPQALCSGATCTGGTLMYSIDGGTTWSTDVPTATAIGTYDVYYRVDADQNHNSIASTLAGTATINPGTVNYGSLQFYVTATDIALTIGESDGTAAGDITIPADIEVNSITMERTFTVGKAATIMLPFDIAVSKVSGGTFYSFIGVDKSGAEWEVVMQEVNRVSGSLQAHTPYLFMPTATQMTFDLGGEAVTVKANSQQTYTVQP